MKKRFLLTGLILFSLLTLVFIPTAKAGPAEKQVFLNNLNDFSLPSPDYANGDKINGSFQAVLEKLDFTSGGPKAGISLPPGSQLKADYQIDLKNQKMAFDFSLTAESTELNLSSSIKGQVFISGNKIIVPRGTILAFALFDPQILNELPAQLPAYVVFESSASNFPSSTKMTPKNVDFQPLLAYFLTSVPDSCFVLQGSTVTLSLSQSQAEQVMYDLRSRIKQNPSEIADILVQFMEKSGQLPNNSTKEEFRTELISELGAISPSGSSNEIETDLSAFQFSISPESLKLKAGLGIEDNSSDLDLDAAIDYRLQQQNGTYQGGTDFTLNMQGEDVYEKLKIAFTTAFKSTSSSTQNDVRITFDFSESSQEEMHIVIRAKDQAQVTRDLSIAIPFVDESNSLTIKDQFANKQNKLRLYVDGSPVSFSDAAPFIEEGRTMVPLRSVGEALDCEVMWKDGGVITLVKDQQEIQLEIGQYSYQAGGKTKSIDVAPMIIDNRTYVPLRFVAEEFDFAVQYDAATQTIFLYSLQI